MRETSDPYPVSQFVSARHRRWAGHIVKVRKYPGPNRLTTGKGSIQSPHDNGGRSPTIMSYRIDFPKIPKHDAAPYTGLADGEEVYEVVCAETKQSIENMGSKGYDLVWPEGFDPDTLEDLPEDDQFSKVADAHEAGVQAQAQVKVHAPTIFADLWYVSETLGESLDAPKTSTLPDGTVVRLTTEQA